MRKVRAIIKAPGENARYEYISTALHDLQAIVGGYIELVRLTPDTSILCNENGIALGLDYNLNVMGMPILGTVIALNVDKRGDFQSIDMSMREFERLTMPRKRLGYFDKVLDEEEPDERFIDFLTSRPWEDDTYEKGMNYDLTALNGLLDHEVVSENDKLLMAHIILVMCKDLAEAKEQFHDLVTVAQAYLGEALCDDLMEYYTTMKFNEYNKKTEPISQFLLLPEDEEREE